MHPKEKLKSILEKPIFKQFSWYFLATTITQLISLVSVFIVYRYLGPINTGLLAFTQNFLIGANLAITAIDNHFYWSILKNKKEDQIKYLIEYFWKRLYLIISVNTLSIISAFLLLPDDVFILVLVASITSIFVSVFNIFTLYLNLLKEARFISLVTIFQAVLFFIIKLSLVYFNAELVYFLFFSTVEFLSYASLFLLLKKRYILFNDIVKYKPNLFEGLKKSLKLLLDTKNAFIFIIANYFIYKTDQLYLSATTDAETLGIYVGAVKIVEIINLFLGVLITTTAPYVASKYSDKSDVAKQKINEKYILFIFVFLSSAAALVVMTFSDFIIKFIYGLKFAQSGQVLYYYALTVVPGLVINYYGSIYPAKNRYITNSLILIFATILNIIGIIILYPALGLIGVSLATLIAYVIAAVMLYISDKYNLINNQNEK